jgi:1-deoxy-D-xylulose-5-phosphate synthase
MAKFFATRKESDMRNHLGRNILPGIRHPSDLKSLSLEELKLLAEEIRELIIKTTDQNGGHLASNLGIVELTLALHLVFDFSRDRLIWDVGHQCYPHKLITGRQDRFHTLRQKKGLSGFPKASESVFDAFGAGHSSTSLSAAVGFAEAFRKQKKNLKAVAVIGDGALSGGMS